MSPDAEAKVLEFTPSDHADEAAARMEVIYYLQDNPGSSLRWVDINEGPEEDHNPDLGFWEVVVPLAGTLSTLVFQGDGDFMSLLKNLKEEPEEQK